MDAEEARRNLEAARRSYEDSVTPRLPPWAPPVCAVLVAVAVALVGLAPSPGWLKLVSIIAGVLLAGAAAMIVLGIRARQGIVGVRGPAREKWSAVIVSGLAVLVSAFSSTPDTRWIYVGVAVFVGAYTWFVLRKQVRG